MKSLDFTEVASIINKSKSTEIETSPMDLLKGKWALYKGTNKVSTFIYKFYILYLYAEFRKDDARRAANAILYPKNTQIVYAPSLNVSFIDEIKVLKKDIAGCYNIKEYLLSFIRDQMSNYTGKLKSLKPAYFVEPSYETPSGILRKIPNPVAAFFTDQTEDLEGGALGVLLAEPGQGKTYTAQQITISLLDRNFIPIFIHSPQWVDMREDDLTSIYKTVTHSFRFFNSQIDWINNFESEFINVTLKLGLFRIVFDGFDEYILWNKGKITAEQVIKNLYNLAIQSNSRILITSRTTFWESNILEDDCKEKLFFYKIKPFDQNHAKNYFEKRFPNDNEKIGTAIKIFSSLRNSGDKKFSSTFAGRGFILSLIGDLSSSDWNAPIYDGNHSVIQWIMVALCQREEKRQQLPIDADQQLAIFRLFTEMKARGNDPCTSLLKNAVELICDKLIKEEIDSLIGDAKKPGKLCDHPLIYQDIKGDVWLFKHEQIEFNLLAEQIIEYINKNSPSLKKFFDELVISGSYLEDLGDIIFEQLEVEHYKSDDFYSFVIRRLISTIPLNDIHPRKRTSALLLSSNLIMSALNKRLPIGRLKKDRMDFIKKMVPEQNIHGLQFTGTISSLDCNDTTFSSCRFENITWANCIFNENTVFKNCYFSGGEIKNCEGFGLCDFLDSEFDDDANVVISNETIRDGNKQIQKEDVRRHIEMFIKKFIAKDGLFRTVFYEHILRGPLSKSQYKDILLEVMEKHIIEKHKISHLTGYAYNVKQTAKNSITHYLHNGVFSEELAKSFHEICTKLKIE
jgi:hypothetical protein